MDVSYRGERGLNGHRRDIFICSIQPVPAKGTGMSISAPFIHRPVATTLIVVAITLVGAIGYTLLPVAAIPQVDFPTIGVSASLPGASPEIMASSVATPLERQFGR